MKKFILFLISLTLTACTNIEAARHNGQDFANQLEKKQDVIETIAQYKKYQNKCKRYYNTRDYLFSFGVSQCAYDEGLSEKGIDFGCIESWRDSDYYNSDECIVFRRNLHESKVDYFDYKRFLPNKTKIQTDDEFLWLVDYFYETTFDCDKQKNITTTEKQNCKEYVKDTTIKLATHGGVKCSDLYKMSGTTVNKYTETLKFWGQHYGYLIYYYDETPQTAYEVITEWAKDFGREHLCDITGWQTDIRKIGYKM